MTPSSIQRIAVIGSGIMGQGIAQVCALAGYEVLLYDANHEMVSDAFAAITKSLAVAISKNKITVDQKERALSLLKDIHDFKQLQVDLVIEAVTEKIEIKHKIFSELEKINSRDCIFLTNTSSLSITQIGSVLKYPNRFAGLHFFNPANIMKLVEIIRGATTSDEVISLIQNFAKRLGKTFVMAQDSPGFITNRVARPFYLESLKLLEEGVADHETIDKLLVSSGFKMGPFELMDFIGIDTNLAVTNSLYNAFNQESRFRPSLLQQQKVNGNQLGKKSGNGFYKY